MKNIDQVMERMTPVRRARIEGRARELIGEEMALQQLRKARHLTQEQIARALNVGQDSVSRIENRSDLLISTLQSYIEAMGGTMKIVVQFKEGTAILSGFGALDASQSVKRTTRRPVLRKKRHLELARAD